MRVMGKIQIGIGFFCLMVSLYLSCSLDQVQSGTGVKDTRVDSGKTPVKDHSRNSEISSDGNGHVYVAWEDGRNDRSDIYFNFSSDYGMTWQTRDIRLDTGDTPGAHSGSPQISSDDSGHVYVTWRDFRNGKIDIYFNYSADYGVTWQTNDIRLDTGDAPGAHSSTDPQISSDGSGHVYVTWYERGPLLDMNESPSTKRNGGVYFNYSSDYGVTWQTSDIRIDDRDNFIDVFDVPQLQIRSDDSGHVYVTWKDGRNTSDILYDIYFNYSSDYGETWQTNAIRLDTGDAPGAHSSTDPQISSDGSGHVYVTWSDGRNSNDILYDIYFNYSSDYGETWQDSAIRLDTGDAPGAHDSFNPRISSDGSGHVYVAWNERGPLLDIEESPSTKQNGGVYFNYSSDYGVTWQTSDIRIDDRDNFFNGFDVPELQISSDDSGHVYVIWMRQSNIYGNHSSDYGVTWQTNFIRLDTGNAPDAHHSIRQQISSDDSGHVYVTWQDLRNGSWDIYFNYSADYGVTWQTPDIRIDTAPVVHVTGLGYALMPHMISDSNGHVYVTWSDWRNGNRDIYFNYSVDYGVTWKPRDVRLDRAAGGKQSYDPRINSDGKGHVYVAWVDDRNGRSDVYFNYSADNGVTWQPRDVRFDTGDSPGANYSWDPQISSDDSGHVYVVWEDGRSGGRDIYFNYSSDYGVTWQENDIRLDTGDAPGANGSGRTQISSDGSGHVYVTWQDGRNGLGDIYFNHSDDYGVTWQASAIRLDTLDTSGVNSSFDPKISSDSKGHVYVTWVEVRNGGRDIYFNYSSDYGVRWQTSAIRLDTGDAPGANSFNPRISSDGNGHVYVLWKDYRNGASDIYLNYSDDYGETWLASDIRLDTGDAPGAHRSTYPQISSDDNGHVYVTWQDERNSQSGSQYNTIYFNYFFVEGVVNLNDSVKVHPIESTFHVDSDTTGCPDGFVGRFMFDGEIANRSDQLFTDLVIQVGELTRGNLLKVAEGELGGEGTTLTLPERGDYSDGILSPAESVVVPFAICLKELRPFDLFIDVLGKQGLKK